MAGVRVLFLGPLRDLAECGEMTLGAPLDWHGLMAAVPARVAEQLESGRVSVACAGQVLADRTALDARDGDEVALLPPVSGG